MPTFELQFPPDQIEALAERFGYMDESKLLTIGENVRARGYYTRGEFIEVCAFKSVRSRPKIAANSRDAIVSATVQRLPPTTRACGCSICWRSTESACRPRRRCCIARFRPTIRS